MPGSPSVTDRGTHAHTYIPPTHFYIYRLPIPHQYTSTHTTYLPPTSTHLTVPSTPSFTHLTVLPLPTTTSSTTRLTVQPTTTSSTHLSPPPLASLSYHHILTPTTHPHTAIPSHQHPTVSSSLLALSRMGVREVEEEATRR
ncbi:hypothetical protein Pmani_010545 [Petrolisthes manimaculis]|uniref:Uncharacterized protein n=1 Tax=Petrolisthes manimaculis TaxID=1843537 RepID=A0AAE1Q1Y6_9EUCA|nr:hypothetical protein Pmani_010545 [Petrolisthes manimaculis]